MSDDASTDARAWLARFHAGDTRVLNASHLAEEPRWDEEPTPPEPSLDACHLLERFRRARVACFGTRSPAFNVALLDVEHDGTPELLVGDGLGDSTLLRLR